MVEKLQQLQEEPEEEEEADGPGTAPDWTQVDQDQARALWDWLLEWCQNILWPTYAEEVWKPRWYRHQRLRIELTWLCAYWYWSYEPKSPPTRAAEWHARWWPYVEKVMREELSRCGYVSENLREPRHAYPVDVKDADGNLVQQAPYSGDDFADDELFASVERHIARRPTAEEKKERAAAKKAARKTAKSSN